MDIMHSIGIKNIWVTKTGTFMKTLRLLLNIIVLMLILPTLQAQIDYLGKAKEFLAQGDCERAEYAYQDYKKAHPNGNIEVAKWIEDCKKVGTLIMKGVAARTYNGSGVEFRMLPVQGGTFQMGSEKSIHAVTLSDFWMGETEVTQELWKMVMGTSIQEQLKKHNPDFWLAGEGADYPMYYVSYYEVESCCRKLNNLLKEQLPAGWYFTLPTEAQWEFAARGGNISKNYIYSGSNDINEVAWYIVTRMDKGNLIIAGGNSDAHAHPVKRMKANELGLYDMSGNAVEWCRDYYQNNYYDMSAPVNPECTTPDEKSSRVLRGGAWSDEESQCAVAGVRYCATPDGCANVIGFRIALVSQ